MSAGSGRQSNDASSWRSFRTKAFIPCATCTDFRTSAIRTCGTTTSLLTSVRTEVSEKATEYYRLHLLREPANATQVSAWRDSVTAGLLPCSVTRWLIVHRSLRGDKGSIATGKCRPLSR